MLFPLVPLAALVVAVVFWGILLYQRRTTLASSEIRSLGFLVCVNATGVLMVLALMGSQDFLAGWIEGSPNLQSIASVFCK